MSTPSHSTSDLSITLGRSVLVLLNFLFCASLSAQKAPELDYLIRFAAPLTPTQEKYIHETIQGHEAGAHAWVDGPNQQVKVRTHVALQRAPLEEAWSPVGLQITYLGPIDPPHGTERAQEGPVPSTGMPVFVDTGNPAADNAAYEAAKAAWLAAHRKEQGVVNEQVEPE